jgi:hypothetical protein
MRDSGDYVSQTKARLLRAMDERECRRRNALSRFKPGFRLQAGDEVSVVETLGSNYLVEVKTAGDCAWMGVLSPGEIEVSGKGERG